MKVFVTGGTGFVGSHLVEALLNRGDEVTCLVRNPSKAQKLFAAHMPRTVEGNLFDNDALSTGCEGVDAVFHVAGVTAARSPSEFHTINAEATRTVVHVAKRAAANLHRFVSVSSVAAVGPSALGRVVPDDQTPQPVTEYGRSKLSGENVVRESGLPWTIIRPPPVYGPRDLAMLKLFKLAKRGLLPVFGNGSQELSLVYVKDLAGALLAAIHPATAGKHYFVCHNEICTARSLVLAIHGTVSEVMRARGKYSTPRIVPIPPLLARTALWITGTAARVSGKRSILSADRANEFLAEAWTCSSAGFERDTGWKAETDLFTGLAKTAEWYAEAGWI